ncbi:hypothetical protein BESB_028210 [Besnoitia besnoiti]|uniref:DEP domain-containing protein n=1 Tax=Besnoitia besnoiti TaxID=94643 RepID=A0A2A9M677_BESBE|nr:uncharacterized protein BESB_028210 [Besnoitia besnoiti]PFH31386.1 hypothetical protein BESB_028210 [Besnoitia besnoiti]
MANQITIFTEAQCAACREAKRLLQALLLKIQGDDGLARLSPSSLSNVGFSLASLRYAACLWSSSSPSGSHFALPAPGYCERHRRSAPAACVASTLATLREGEEGDAENPRVLRAASSSQRLAAEAAGAAEDGAEDVAARAAAEGAREPSARRRRTAVDEGLEEEAQRWRLVEISLTQYPERRSELMQLSNSFAVPQVFFNNYLVGGLQALQQLEAAGALEPLLTQCRDNYAYRTLPAVSRALWKERETEKDRSRRWDCGASVRLALHPPPPHPFFDTPLSLYQRSSIAGRVEEARRASEGGLHRPSSTPTKESSSSRFSLRLPLHHSVRLCTGPSASLPPSAAGEFAAADLQTSSVRGERERQGPERVPARRRRFSATSMERSRRDDTPEEGETQSEVAEAAVPADALEHERRTRRIRGSFRFVGRRSSHSSPPAAERQQGLVEGGAGAQETRPRTPPLLHPSAASSCPARCSPSGTAFAAAQAQGEEKKEPPQEEEECASEEAREGEEGEEGEREVCGGDRGREELQGEANGGRRISFQSHPAVAELERKALLGMSFQSSYFLSPSSCTRVASLSPLDPRFEPPLYSPRKSASSKEAEEIKNRDPFYAGAFYIPATEADLASGEATVVRDPLTGQKMKRITYATLLRILQTLLPIAERAGLRAQKHTFVASEAVTVFCNKLHFASREAAVQFGADLVRRSVIELANQDQLVTFADSPSLVYRLQMHQEPLVLNWTVIWTKPVLSSFMGLAKFLHNFWLELEEAHREVGGLVNAAEVKSDPRYLEFQIAVCELQTVDLLSLKSETVKKTFLINIYNLLSRHALIEVGVPSDTMPRKNFFSSVSYCIGGYRFTLNELENGLLRCNRRSCYSLTKPFGFRDQRLRFVLNEFDPRIHFALNSGARSCPPVRFYEAESIEEELRIAGEAFCESDSNVRIDLPGKTLWLSKIFSWYENDFGSNAVKVALFLLPFLRGEKREDLGALLRAAKVRIPQPESPREGAAAAGEFCDPSPQADAPFATCAASPRSPEGCVAAGRGFSLRIGGRDESRPQTAPPRPLEPSPACAASPGEREQQAERGDREDKSASEPGAADALAAAAPSGEGGGVCSPGARTPGGAGGGPPGTFFQKLLTRSRSSIAAIENSPLAHAASLFTRSGSSIFLPGTSGAAFKIKYLEFDWTADVDLAQRYRGSWIGDVVGRVQTAFPAHMMSLTGGSGNRAKSPPASGGPRHPSGGGGGGETQEERGEGAVSGNTSQASQGRSTHISALSTGASCASAPGSHAKAGGGGRTLEADAERHAGETGDARAKRHEEERRITSAARERGALAGASDDGNSNSDSRGDGGGRRRFRARMRGGGSDPKGKAAGTDHETGKREDERDKEGRRTGKSRFIRGGQKKTSRDRTREREQEGKQESKSR